MKSFKIKDIDITGLAVSLEILDLQDKHTMSRYFALFELCFGRRANIDMRLFEWLNNEYPHYKNLNFAFVDQATGELIAAYGLQPGDAFVDGSIKKYALCTNVMSHPDYGGKGLFRVIGREALAFASQIGINFCFGVPNDKALNGHLKVGWKVVNEITFFENPLDGKKHPKTEHAIVPDALNSLSDPDLFSFYHDKYSFYFTRTNAWYKWRMSKPNTAYLNFGIDNGANKGFMVLKEYLDAVTGKKKMHIVDFGYNNSDCFAVLLDHCLWTAGKNNCDLVNLWHYAINEEESKQLISSGFRPTEQRNKIILHTLGKQTVIPEGRWHVTLFDNDVY